jgi:hypothetical protein
MGTSWNSWQKSQPEIQNTTSWEQSTFLWRASNILGWSLSTVVGLSNTFCGAARQTTILGPERKINAAEQFNWQWLKSYKVMLRGQELIDLEKVENANPNQVFLSFFNCSKTARTELKTAENDIKALSTTETVGSTKTETYGTHLLSCAVGGSTEDVLQKTITAEASLKLSGRTSVAIQSGGVSIAMSPTSLMLTAPTINIG